MNRIKNKSSRRKNQDIVVEKFNKIQKEEQEFYELVKSGVVDPKDLEPLNVYKEVAQQLARFGMGLKSKDFKHYCKLRNEVIEKYKVQA